MQRRALRLLPPSCAAAACCVVAHYSSSSSDVRAAYVRSKHNSSSHYCSVRHTSSHGVAATTTTATASGANTATRPSVMSSAARTHATDGAATADEVTRNGDAALSDSGDGDDEAAVYALYNDHVDIATDNDAAAVVTDNNVDNVDDDDIDDDGVAMSTQASAHDKDALYRRDLRHDAVHAHTTAATAVDAVQDDASASLPSSMLQAQYRHAMGTMLVYLYNAYDAEHLSVATLSPVKQQMLYDARAAMQRRLQRHRHRQTAQHAHDRSSNNDGDNAHAAVTTTATGAANDDHTVATASDDDDDDSSDSNRAHAEATAAMPAMFLADVLVYLRHEVALEQVLSQRSIRGRARARLWLRVLSPLRLSALERQYVLRRVCSVVERRAVSLVSATRLLRRRWPSTLRGDSGCATHYHYLLRSLLAWLSDALQLHSSSSSTQHQQQPQHDDSAATTTRDDNKTAAAAVRAVCALSPRDARGVLENCAATLRSQSGNAAVSALTRCLIARATADVYTRAAHTRATTAAAAVTAAASSPPTHAPLHPSALISLLWGIHTSGAHVPVCVWCDVVQQLIAMDGTLRGTVSDVATSTHLLYNNNNNNSSSSSSSSSRHRGVVGDTDVTHAHTTTTTTQATADDGNDDDKAATSTMTYRDALRLRRASVGHVFSGLTTRQIYRLLAVLRDAGLLTTTHVDGARDTPSLSPSPQEQQQQHSAAWLRLDGASDDDDGDGGATGVHNSSSDTYASATTTTASSTRRPAVWALPATTMVALHALADSALKNVVFETAAGGSSGDATTTTARMTRRAVLRRTQRVADLTPHELLDLLTLAAQLRVPFSVSAQRVAEQLLTPMIDQLRDEQALTFLQATRRTNCATPSLLRAFAQMLQRRGRHAPRALPLAKALLRTLLQQQPQLLLLQPSPLLLYRTDVVDGNNNNNDNDTMTGRLYDDDDDARDAQQTAQQRRALATAADDNNDNGGAAATDVIERFVDDFLQLCAESICRVHATELIVLCELLYGLARRLAPDAATAQRVRALVDAACAQMERLLQLGVVHVGVASRLLEYTVVLGMRRELARYDGVARLLRTRAVAIAHTAAQREQRDRPHSDRSSRDDDNNAAVAKATTCDNTRHAATVVASTPTASDAHAAVTHDNNDDDHAQTTTATTAAAACATCARSDNDDDTASMSPRALRLRRACEAQLPTLSRAALGVYGELLFMYERMAVMQARVHDSERRRFTHALERVGLYALLHGAALLRDGHLHTPPPPPLTQQQQQQQQRYSNNIDDHVTTAHATTSSPPPPLPLWLEKRVSAVVQTKLTRAALTSQSSNDAVLRVLGHVHCDVHKVRQLLQMLEYTPLLLLRRRRAVLLYAQELARRFAGAPEQAHVAKLLQHALY